MHSPRIRVPSQSSKTTMYKSWIGGKPPKSSTSKPLQDEIEKFKLLYRQCEEENRNLLDTLSAFNTIDDISSQNFLIDQFEKDLNQISKRIDKRSILINSIEKKSSRRKEAVYKNQDIFQEKTQLIAENEQLVNKALFLEKKMIAAKLKLRLNHDHRDFCRLKRQLSRLADNDITANDEELEIYRNKEIIRNLKNAIEHEKTRLLRINAPPSLEEEAAEIIQKVWRGYRTRKSLQQPTKNDNNNIISNDNNNNDNNKTDSFKGDDITFPELEDSEKVNDGNSNQIIGDDGETTNDETTENQTANEENENQVNDMTTENQTTNEITENQTTNEENENQVNDETAENQTANEENENQVNDETTENQTANEENENQANDETTENQATNEENENQGANE